MRKISVTCFAAIAAIGSANAFAESTEAAGSAAENATHQNAQAFRPIPMGTNRQEALKRANEAVLMEPKKPTPPPPPKKK